MSKETSAIDPRRGIVLTPVQTYYMRVRGGDRSRWLPDPTPITGSIGLYDGVPIVELPLWLPAPEGLLDLRTDTPLEEFDEGQTAT